MALTELQIQAQWRAFTDFFEEARANGESVSKSVLVLQAALTALSGGDFAAELESAVGTARSRYSTFLGSDTAVLTWILRHYGRLLATPETNPRRLFRLVYDRFVTLKMHVKSRGFTLNSPAAGGSNVGTSQLLRLKVDENGYTIESGRADAKTAEVIADAYSKGGKLHEEILELRGAYASRDLLELSIGSGAKLPITALTSSNAGTLANAGFEQVTSTSAVAVGSPQVVTGVTSWDLVSGSWSSITAQADTPCKSLQGVTLPIALTFTGNVKIRQKLSTANVKIERDRPYLCGVWMKKNGSTTGNGVLALESSATATATQSVTQNLASLTLDTWTFVPIALGTGSYFKNFNTDNLSVSLATTSLAVSTVSFDEVVFAPGTFFDGSWYWFMGGYTPSRRLDTFSWTDTDGGTGKNQRHIARALGEFLPHVPNATQVTAAGGRTLTFANSGSADTITASSGSFVSDGYVAGMLVTIAGTSSNNMTTGQIATVTATVLTFGADTVLVNEGALSSTATLNATGFFTDPT